MTFKLFLKYPSSSLKHLDIQRISNQLSINVGDRMTGSNRFKQQCLRVLLNLQTVLIYPPVILRLICFTIIGKVTEDMFLSLINYSLLDTSKSKDLKAIFRKCTSLIKDHHINSSRHIYSLGRDAVDLIFSKTTDCKSGTCSHCCWKCWRHSYSY